MPKLDCSDPAPKVGIRTNWVVTTMRDGEDNDM